MLGCGAARIGAAPGSLLRLCLAHPLQLLIMFSAPLGDRRAGDRIDAFLERYYGQPAAAMRRRQACFGGPAAAAAEFLDGFATAGAGHIIVRLVGDPDRQLETLATLRKQLAW